MDPAATTPKAIIAAIRAQAESDDPGNATLRAVYLESFLESALDKAGAEFRKRQAEILAGPRLVLPA